MIRPDTNTSGAPTKVDNGMALAGNQHVSGGLVHIAEHLPYSPAQGAPLYDQAFAEGKGWTKVEGKLHPGSGPGNNSW